MQFYDYHSITLRRPSLEVAIDSTVKQKNVIQLFQRHFQTAVTSQGTFNHKARYNQRSFALISWTLTAPNIARPPYFLDIVLRNVRGLMDNYDILDFKSLSKYPFTTFFLTT